MTLAAIECNGMWKRYRHYTEHSQSLKEMFTGRRNRYEEFWVLQDINFEVMPGDALGIIGGNGQGKSTLLKTIAGILAPDKGNVVTRGRISSLLELGIGFHHELTGRENIFLARALLGEGKSQTQRKFEEIVDFAGIEEFIDLPIKNYSSGMVARLAFSTAISIDPEILLIDEVLAVGDAAFQYKCNERLAAFRRAGTTILLVSHSLASVEDLCNKSLLIEDHKVKALGETGKIVSGYMRKTAMEIEIVDEVVEQVGLRIVGMQYSTPGNPTESINSGDSVWVDFSIKSDTLVKQVALEFAITSPHAPSHALYAYHTSRTGQLFDFHGEQQLRLKIPQAHLTPGVYFLSLGLLTPDHLHRYDLQMAKYKLIVNELDRPCGEVAPMALNAIWELQDSRSEVELSPSAAST